MRKNFNRYWFVMLVSACFVLAPVRAAKTLERNKAEQRESKSTTTVPVGRILAVGFVVGASLLTVYMLKRGSGSGDGTGARAAASLVSSAASILRGDDDAPLGGNPICAPSDANAAIASAIFSWSPPVLSLSSTAASAASAAAPLAPVILPLVDLALIARLRAEGYVFVLDVDGTLTPHPGSARDSLFTSEIDEYKSRMEDAYAHEIARVVAFLNSLPSFVLISRNHREKVLPYLKLLGVDESRINLVLSKFRPDFRKKSEVLNALPFDHIIYIDDDANEFVGLDRQKVKVVHCAPKWLGEIEDVTPMIEQAISASQ